MLTTELMLDIIEDVKKIAKEAGEEILNIYNSNEGFDIEHKSDDSPLTIADKRANNIIVKGLKKLDVVFPIISEETKLVDYQERQSYKTCWMVDPLDGTKEFIKRNGEFTVNIALIHESQSVLGVVYVPVTGETYSAVKDEGAIYCTDETCKMIECNEFKIDAQGLRVVCSRSHLNDATKAFVDKLDSPELVSKGSSLKFLTLAEGNAELYPRLAPTMEWDTAAAHIILEEAGGHVLNAENNQPLHYNKEDLLNPHFLATATVFTLDKQ